VETAMMVLPELPLPRKNEANPFHDATLSMLMATISASSFEFVKVPF
jgi:hypothetical protein